MKKYIIGIFLTTSLLFTGCNQEALEEQKDLETRSEVQSVQKELDYPYNEVKKHFKGENFSEEVLMKIKEFPEFPMLDHVQSGDADNVAKLVLSNLNEIKILNDFVPLEEWIIGVEAVFTKAIESDDEEVEYDKLLEGERKIKELQKLILSEE